MATKKQPAKAPASKSTVRRAAARRAVESREASPLSRYINRDESWLRFNSRVLEEADDTTNPLLERLKFLAITSSNLDEFLEIRVAGSLQQIEEDTGLKEKVDEGGFTPTQRLDRLNRQLHAFADDQCKCWHERLSPALAEAGIRLVTWKQLRSTERAFATKFFHEQVDPLLTPVTLDPAHPFPRVLNKALCLALLLRHKRKSTGGKSTAATFGVVTIPRSLPALLALPEQKGQRNFILLEDLIDAHLEPMFRGYKILGRAAFRVTRNSNLYMEEEESRSILESVRSELHNRRKGDVVRMEIESEATDEIIEALRINFELDPWQVFRTTAPVNLSRFFDLYSALPLPDLKFPEFHGRRPAFTRSSTLFDHLRKQDILLHHPFDSFNTVENFVQSASEDPNVISIKQTLYRTSANSPIFRALTDAAQSREVDTTVVVELMARFDEASNIRWARELEDAGVQVFHGIFGLKTHCKLALLVRKDPDGVMRSYAHLGTGNYNPVTARFYTDISLLTCRPEITEAVRNVFRYLTADWEGVTGAYRPLLVAPITLAQDVLSLIARETANAKAGKPSRIIAKMNGLLDGPTIDALYEASNAGVEIDLIIRGMCALRPGVPGMSERIRVRSIIGRFLEHSRIFWFQNDATPEVYCGSADWMVRNLHERCEVVFPVNDEAAAKRLRWEILESYLCDTAKSRLMRSDGTYKRTPHKLNTLSAQDWLIAHSQQ